MTASAQIEVSPLEHAVDGPETLLEAEGPDAGGVALAVLQATASREE